MEDEEIRQNLSQQDTIRQTLVSLPLRHRKQRDEWSERLRHLTCQLCLVRDVRLVRKYNLCVCDFHFESPVCTTGSIELLRYYTEMCHMEIVPSHISYAMMGKNYDKVDYLIDRLEIQDETFQLWISEENKKWLQSIHKWKIVNNRCRQKNIHVHVL